MFRRERDTTYQLLQRMEPRLLPHGGDVSCAGGRRREGGP